MPYNGKINCKLKDYSLNFDDVYYCNNENNDNCKLIKANFENVRVNFNIKLPSEWIPDENNRTFKYNNEENSLLNDKIACEITGTFNIANSDKNTINYCRYHKMNNIFAYSSFRNLKSYRIEDNYKITDCKKAG